MKIELEKTDLNELIYFSKFLGYVLALEDHTAGLTSVQRQEIAYEAIYGERE